MVAVRKGREVAVSHTGCQKHSINIAKFLCFFSLLLGTYRALETLTCHAQLPLETACPPPNKMDDAFLSNLYVIQVQTTWHFG